MMSIRWAFSSGCWRPAAEEWTLAMASIQTEEWQRINRFAFRRDARAALAGRLLIRRAIVEQTGMPWADITLDRTEKGKPFLANCPPTSDPFDFNISHDGDYVVLASEKSHQVGIDTMKLSRLPGAKSAGQFFSTMSRQLTDIEWSDVKSSESEAAQLATFYRYWCLKESYVKSVGFGIGLSLDRLECYVRSPLDRNRVVCDTEIAVDGEQDLNTRFEESLLDEHHVVCVALKTADRLSLGTTNPANITTLSTSDLLCGIQPIRDRVAADWETFCQKPEQPLLLRD